MTTPPPVQEALKSIPRVSLLDRPTPLRRLHRIEAVLGTGHGVGIYVKRDDNGELAGGGNKLRKLEFLLGDALSQHAKSILTVGGLQSNHARLTAAACVRLGLHCELFLGRAVARFDHDYEQSGNILLDKLLGARLHMLPAGTDPFAAALERARQLEADGSRAYVIPSGGSTPLGSLGYVECAIEIASQERDLALQFDAIYVPNGSSGTHAGLAAGFHALGRSNTLVRSFSVLAERDTTMRRTHELAEGALHLLGLPASMPFESVDVDGSQRGAAYGAATDSMKAAVHLVAAEEALFLDPVYSGKAFAGMLADIANGRYRRGQNVLFVMTGGTPGLYAYRSEFIS
ncbi:D-cysteine desulfhydrase family protein [Cupriavidus sp. 2SB]|uniref:D-cysteine desulfhydrase family protein n=1 Tax=Cupriavidus sp. 2SB TaxID=2502199 RepID=UPI0010F980E3|nr:D-cysteine desulfhydrase family protein [Cupriavidus sp. 2SB]